MRVQDGDAAPWRRSGMLTRVTATGVAVMLAASTGLAGVSFADEAASQNDASADAQQQVESADETSLEQQLTKLGASSADVATGNAIEDQTPTSDEKVTIIVQLDDNWNSGVQLFGLSFGAPSSESRHDSMRDAIRNVVAGESQGSGNAGGLQLFSTDDGSSDDSIEEIADYYNVIDGFAIKAPASALEAIQNLDGVKNAFVEQSYSIPSDMGVQSTNALNQSSLDMTNADDVAYRGDGQTIAIIDSGLQIDHEAFDGDMSGVDVAWTEEEVNAAKTNLVAGKSGVYTDSKIVFSYDYADNDNEVTPGTYTDLTHGTHVAGIAAANGGQIEGAAPNAQIMMFKVCDDLQGNIYDSNLIAAMDDVAALDKAGEASGNNIDVVNMSLGSDNGFGAEGSRQTYADAVNALENQGIVVNVAAGNAYNAAYGNKSGENLPYATDPDAEIISCPAAFDNSFAVASVNNAEGSSVFYFADEKVAYRDVTAQDGTEVPLFNALDEGSYDIVDGGIGSAADVAALSEAQGGTLAGKMVLIQRGGEDNGEKLSFEQKLKNVASLNPVAIVFYDNASGSNQNFGFTTAQAIPSVGISLEAGESIKQAIESGSAQIKIVHDAKADSATFENYVMSDFSSWGTTPEMDIKPEITAPGGNIYSSVSGSSNAYAYMSGTSMATPQMAGITAQVHQYIEANPALSGKSQDEKNSLVSQLLMSTARPIVNSADSASYYSPRKQGAGLANVEAAVSTPVYVTVDGAKVADRPKADLGESSNGTWSFKVTLHNFSDSEASYTPDTHAISDTVADGLFQQASKDWTGAGIDVSYTGLTDGAVVVPANGSASYTVNISCGSAFTEWAAANTPNGTFVEGFALLKAADGSGNPNLSTPFCGFYGDWDAVPAFDSDSYSSTSKTTINGEEVATGSHVIGTALMSGTTNLPLGINPLDGGTSLAVNGDYSSFVHHGKQVVSSTPYSSSPNSASPMTGLRRNLTEYKVEYTNEQGEVVRSFDQDYQVKSRYASGYGMTYGEQWTGPFAFAGQDESTGNYLPQGTYTMTKTATTAGGDGSAVQKQTDSFYYDTQAPVISNISYSGQGDERVLSFDVTDNSWLAAVQFYDTVHQGYFLRQLADDKDGNGSATVSEASEEQYVTNEDGTRTWHFDIPISNLRSAWQGVADEASLVDPMPDTVALYAYDYGLNGGSPETVVINQIAPTAVDITPDETTLYEGQSMTLSSAFAPSNTTETGITYESTDPTVASVDGKGVVTAHAKGDVTITGTSTYDASVSDTVTVHVSEVPESVGIAMQANEATVSFGSDYDAKVVVSPAYASDSIVWSSSNESIVAVKDSSDASAGSDNVATGTITAGDTTGNATLTATLTHVDVTTGESSTYTASMTVKVRQDNYADFVIDETYPEGPRLLYYGGSLQNVTIPDNVEVIGPQAFADTGCQTVTVPASVEKIEYGAFEHMPNLTTVNFEDSDTNPSRLTTMEDNVFYYDLKLDEITLPRNLVNLGEGTFNTSSVKKVTFPYGLTKIPAQTLYYCSVQDVVMSDAVTEIGDKALSSDGSLGSISVVKADGSVVNGQLPSALTTIADSAFSGTSLGNMDITLPSGVKSVGVMAFSSVSSKNFTLNDGLETIGAGAFQSCGASQMVIPDSVTSVGESAFSNMRNCKSITVGAGVPADSLERAFAFNLNCAEYKVSPATTNYKVVDGVLFSGDGKTLVTVNEGAKRSSYDVPAGTERLGDYAFASTSTQHVTFPEGLREIGASCFMEGSLNELDLPSSMESIGNGAFQNNQFLTSVKVGGTKHIGTYVFYNCQSLTSFDFGTRLESIGDGSFGEDTGFTEFIFPDTLTSISGGCFANMPNLKKVHIGAGMTGSMAGAFTGDFALTEITVSEGNPVYHVADNVLYGEMSAEVDPQYPGKHLILSLPCNTFTEYTVEEGTVSIDEQAFRGNSSLRKVTLPEGIRNLATGSFNSCSNLEEINFPESLEHVTGFYSTDKLTTVDMASVTYIPSNSFMGNMPEHLVVRSGKTGSMVTEDNLLTKGEFPTGAFFDSMDYSGFEGMRSAYFGEGMKTVSIVYDEAPSTLVLPASLESLELSSPTGSNMLSFKVYVPKTDAEGNVTSGWQVAEKTLKSMGVSATHLVDYQPLSATLHVGEPTNGGTGEETGDAKTYAVGVSWYKTGTSDTSSVGNYLGSSTTAFPNGDGTYTVIFSPSPMYADMIISMSIGGAPMEKDGDNYFATLTAEQLQNRQVVDFALSYSGITTKQSCDVEFDQQAVDNMISASQNGTSSMGLTVASATSGDVVEAGGVVKPGKKQKVYVDVAGGVAGSKEYRFVSTLPDDETMTVQDWSTSNVCENWTPITTGQTLTAEVRDASCLTVETAGVVKAMTAAASEDLAALQTDLEVAQAIEQGTSSAGAYQTLQQAIDDAQAVAANDHAQGSDIKSAQTALQQAIADFQLTAGSGTVEAAIAALPEAEAVTAANGADVKAAQDGYASLSEQARAAVSADSVAKLDAVGAAYATQLIANLPNTLGAQSQADVAAARAAYEALSDNAKSYVSASSLQALQAAEAASVDKDVLRGHIGEARAIQQGDKTDAAYAALQAAIAAAESVASSSSATQAQVDAHDEMLVSEMAAFNESGTVAPVKVETCEMLRLYNPNSGEHFYTAVPSERDTLVKAGWQFEGSAWNAPVTSDTPVYRLYNPNGGDHHYTVSEEEMKGLVALGWNYEGIGWYSDDAQGTPLFRLYNPNASSGAHHYTVSKSEAEMLVAAGWNDEGIAWYGVK
ncbi:MAG: leucine-rich repeat protein [Eggerthellaceae bacterium]|nr:leucine-rich repeat protein [Eggerthellaceae bacterium]